MPRVFSCCETIATIPQGMTAIHWASMKGEDQVGLVGKMTSFLKPKCFQR